MVRKSVYTFKFERRSAATHALHRKLLQGVKRRAVVCSTPTSVKSFVLKLIEMLHILDKVKVEEREERRARRGSGSQPGSCGWRDAPFRAPAAMRAAAA